MLCCRLRPSLCYRHGVDYWGLVAVDDVQKDTRLKCRPFNPQNQRSKGGIHVKFIDEENTGHIHDVGTHLSKAWWDSTFPNCPVSFEDFKASPVRVVSTNFGLMTGLLPVAARHPPPVNPQ